MSNPTRPTTAFPAWASVSVPGYVVAPPSGVQDVGFGPGDVYAPAYYNWLFQRSSDWVGYVSQVFDATGRLLIGRIVGQGDPGGSGAGLYITTASGDVRIVTTGSDGIDLDSAGASSWRFRAAQTVQYDAAPTWTFGAPGTPIDWNIICYGTVNLNGFFTASLGYESGSAYTYTTPPTYTIHCSPAQGGFMQIAPLASEQFKWDATNLAAYLTSAAATFIYRAPVQLHGTNVTGSVEAHTLTALKARLYVSNASSGAIVRLIEKTTNGGSPTETVKASITISGATAAYSTEQTGTIASASLDPSKAYCVEVELLVASNSHEVGIQDIYITATKPSVE